MYYKALHVLSAVALASLAIVSTASAVETGYAGTLCNPSTSTDGTRLSYSNQFGIFNPSTAIGNANCGATPTFNADILSVTATFYDRHTTQDVNCNVFLLSGDGGIQASGNIHSDGFGSAPQVRTYNNPIPVSVTSVNLQCTIPPSTSNGVSHISSYRVSSP